MEKLTERQIEIYAEELHEYYQKTQEKRKTRSKQPVEWNRVSEEIKQINRAQVREFQALAERYGTKNIEALAHGVHECWMRNYSDKSDLRMVDYNKLSETEKEKDREVVRCLLNSIFRSDLNVGTLQTNNINSERTPEVKVFISSTFRDMQSERDAINKVVFPFLSDFCGKRGISFTGLDFRWGITEAEVQQGDTVSICLRAVDHCRPYFVGILGGRYGWVPPPELMQFPDMTFQNGISVTEAEILYGAFTGEKDSHAFFCIRDESENTEQECGEEGRQRLALLKQKVKKSGYPILDGYTTIDSFCDFLKRKLTQAILSDFPDVKSNNSFEREKKEHDYFAYEKRSGFAGRSKYLEAVSDIISCLGGSVYITGDTGAGKSALLAQWTDKYAIENPQHFIFTHFIGAANRSEKWESLASRLIFELCSHCGIIPPLLQNSGELVSILYEVLQEASKREEKIIIAVDGADAFLEDKLYGLAWLPKKNADNVHMVFTVNDKKAYSVFENRGFIRNHIELLNTDEQKSLIYAALSRYNKNISLTQIEPVLQAQQAKNPLYLKVLINELCLSGKYEELDTSIDTYLKASDIVSLFGQVINRCEYDYDETHIGMTHNAISFIAMSRDGLTESEIIELLQVPAADWFRLYLALKPYLISRCGALSFAHSSLQNAAANLCSINDREKVKIREKLIEYFMVKKHSHRSIYLLPWLMKETGAYEALFSFLSDEYCFMDLTKTPEELKIYWSETEEATHKTKTIGYKKLIESPEQFPVETIIELARFFAETDSPKEAKKLLVNIISRNSYKVSEVERLSAFGLLGNLAHASGNYCEALEYYRKQIFICEKNKNDMELARTYGNIGLCHKADKCYPEAIDAFKKAQNIFEKIGYFRGVQIALGNQGSVYFDMGDSEYAERLYKAQEQMAAEIGSVAGQASALGGQAAICVLDKQFAEADELLKQQESLCRRISDFWQLSTALGNRAVLLFEQKEYNKAIRSFREKYSICRRLNSASGIENALANLVKVFRQTGNDSEALMYCEKRISFCRKKRLVSQLAEALLEKSSFDFISKGEADFAKAEAQAIIKAHGLNICSEQFKKGGVS